MIAKNLANKTKNVWVLFDDICFRSSFCLFITSIWILQYTAVVRLFKLDAVYTNINIISVFSQYSK
jgi:hypothetical protein